MKYQPTMNRQNMRQFIEEILSGLTPNGGDIFTTDETANASHVVAVCRKWSRKCGKVTKRGTWGWYFARFARCVTEGILPHTVISAAGNIKLPFYSWSTLADFTCPGAGDCLEFCYTFTGWRYPAALLRQLQNTILIRHQRGPIREAFRALPTDAILRLYVDGDIENTDQLAFWFGLLNQRGDVQAYGYSKSWEVFLALANLPAPDNYCLNISSGSKYDGDDDLLQQITDLPVTRGGFHAVQIGNKGPDWSIKSDKRWASTDYHTKVREALRLLSGTKKVFSCPGKCGECLPNGQHACGQRDFVVPIAIGAH